MQFCEKCGTKLKYKQIKIGDISFPGLACEKCGFYTRIEKLMAKTEESASRTYIKVLGDEADEIKTLPTTTIECPKCDNTNAYWWFLQTRSGDEPPTQFYRCTKCNYTWRFYA